LSRGPYQQSPDHQFWRSGVAALPPFAIDPIVSVPFTIAKVDRVATAGSCFAQRIAGALQSNGLNYFVAEGPPASLSSEEARRRNYGIFSCRYANIYTARQLVQLALRAYGRFDTELDHWRLANGHFADPFRPAIEPEGYATLEELRADRSAHLAAVRRMLETLDVFVFTFGLTECWRTKKEGAVLPVAPGVAGGDWDAQIYEFWNMTATEVAADFFVFLDLLKSVNEKAKIILSVSPVSLAATYEPRHALVANAYTKAALRVAADEICRTRPEIAYFPGYEIVTAPCNAARFYEDDQRHVTPPGLTHVMRLFLKHFAPEVAQSSAAGVTGIDIAREAKQMSDVLCEEDILDSAEA
jgi:hypothetical protein